MDTITRRRFLLASGAAGVAGAAATVGWRELSARAQSTPLASGDRVLVVVTLYGGNDGLNTVIPYADSAYQSARGALAYSANEVLPVGDNLALNPAMTGMAGLFKQGRLAIVRGVDYPNPDFSHFRSMDIWQTASPDEPINTGWIGRWLDATGDDPVRAVNIGSVLPPLAVGAKTAAATLPVGKVRKLPAVATTALSTIGSGDASLTTWESQVCASYRSERSVAATFDPILTSSATQPSGTATTSKPAANALSQQLDVIARCVKAGVPTRVYSASLGGFDTHADEKTTQQNQLKLVDDALTSFVTSMQNDPHGRNVVVMVYSEFGRRVAANASGGTDHGSAGPVFVAGVPVRGGFYGAEPSLTDLADGNLKASVDFRAVYAEMLQHVLGADPVQILGSQRPELGLITT